MRTLLLDIETAPNTVHVWGLWDQNVSTNQILSSGYVMCFAAKWLGEDPIIFNSIFHDSRQNMLTQVHKLMDEADTIIHYNGSKFDIPTLNKEFVIAGMNPPSPVKQIDLLKTARTQFKFPSNKLDYVAQALGVGKKTSHKGHELWIECMNYNPDSWATMQEYNINDVLILEGVYRRLLPWIKNHANHGLFAEDGMVCPNCGSPHYQKRGFAYTHAGKYQRYQCSNANCRNWFRSKKAEKTNSFVNIGG